MQGIITRVIKPISESEAMTIADLQKAGRASFELDDIKVTFTKDITTKVAGLEITGQEGDVTNLPRWAARALEDDGYAKISEPDVEPEIKQAMSKENAQADFQLATLDDHFYIRVHEYMKRAPQQKRNELHSMLNTLVRSRIAKISRLVISAELSAANSSKLAVEEKALYTELRKSYDEFMKHVIGDES